MLWVLTCRICTRDGFSQVEYSYHNLYFTKLFVTVSSITSSVPYYLTLKQMYLEYLLYAIEWYKLFFIL